MFISMFLRENAATPVPSSSADFGSRCERGATSVDVSAVSINLSVLWGRREFDDGIKFGDTCEVELSRRNCCFKLGCTVPEKGKFLNGWGVPPNPPNGLRVPPKVVDVLTARLELPNVGFDSPIRPGTTRLTTGVGLLGLVVVLGLLNGGDDVVTTWFELKPFPLIVEGVERIWFELNRLPVLGLIVENI